MGRITFKSKPKQEIRKRVFEKNNFTCQICGWRPTKIPKKYSGKNTIYEDGKLLEVDHVIAVFNGGTNAESNLQTLCNSCNASKGAT